MSIFQEKPMNSNHQNYEKSFDTYLTEIGKKPLLTKEEEIALAKKIKKGDKEALNKLVEHNLRFVVWEAKKYQNRGLNLPDLVAEGNFGLIKAAKTFKPSKKVRFVSWAVYYVKYYILSALMDKAPLVRIPQSAIKDRNKKYTTLVKKNLSADTSQLDGLFHKYLSLDKIHEDSLKDHSSNGGKPSQKYFIDTKSRSPLDIIEETQREEYLKRDIDDILGHLIPGDKKAIELYYGLNTEEGKKSTLREVGGKMGVCFERIRQRLVKGINKMEKDSEILKDYVV